MTQTQSGVTDEQLVELARGLGWETGDAVASPAYKYAVVYATGHPPQRLSWLRTWEGAGAVQTAMAGLGYEMTLRVGAKGNASCVFFSRTVMDWSGWEVAGKSDARTAPEAICLAARAALGLGGVA